MQWCHQNKSHKLKDQTFYCFFSECHEILQESVRTESGYLIAQGVSGTFLPPFNSTTVVTHFGLSTRSTQEEENPSPSSFCKTVTKLDIAIVICGYSYISEFPLHACCLQNIGSGRHMWKQGQMWINPMDHIYALSLRQVWSAAVRSWQHFGFCQSSNLLISIRLCRHMLRVKHIGTTKPRKRQPCERFQRRTANTTVLLSFPGVSGAEYLSRYSLSTLTWQCLLCRLRSVVAAMLSRSSTFSWTAWRTAVMHL